MTFIETEIHAQPQIIANLLHHEHATAQQIAQAIRDFNPAFVCIAARGTSDNAARYAQYLFGTHLGLMVALATPSVHTLYKKSPDLSRALVIGISQSGQSEDVRQVLADANAQGGLTVSITNDAASPLATMAHYHLPLGAGEEISVAATKTYTAELAAIALLAAALTGDATLQAELERLPDYLTQTLQESASIAQWIERYRYIERYAVIGRGYNYCTAYEISLKIKELCYITGEEYSEADFRHGPIAVIQAGFPVILVATNGVTFEKQLDLLQQLHQKGAEALVITNSSACDPYAKKVMRIPADIPEWLSPIAAVIPGQMVAMNLALARGHEVDKPRGLNKVTNTA